MLDNRASYFNIQGNKASINLNVKLFQSMKSKGQLIKSKSKEPIRGQFRTLKKLEDNIDEPQMQQRALTTQKKLAPLIEEPQQKNEDLNPLRYNLIQLLVLMGKKEYYFDKIVKDDLKLIRVFTQSKENPEEHLQKIKKFLSNKVRYKYRSTFKMLLQIQLELLKYTPKKKSVAIKNSQKEFEYDEEDETPKKKKISARGIQDYPTWKRKNNVAPNQKVFIITSGYHALRDALLERNWAENEDAYSPFFDLKWTCSLRSDDFMNLMEFQQINHFDCNQCLCSKYGLARNIRCINNWESFFPRCYDLGDLVDFLDFIEDFKISKIQSILLDFDQSLQNQTQHKNIVEPEDDEDINSNKVDDQNITLQPEPFFNNNLKLDDQNNTIRNKEEKQLPFIVNQLSYRQRFKIRLCLVVMSRVNKSLSNMVKSILKDEFPFIHPGEWIVLLKDPEKPREILIQDYLEQQLKLNGYEDCEGPEFLQKYVPQIKELLKQLNKNPQNSLQGTRNIWIVKPEYSSRGRGIRCLDDIYQILDNVNKETMNYVAMKYIENPLIIKNRKFDIRQWILVTELVPLKIYFYNECYVRFSAEEFDIDQFQNRFAHLTNNAIAKYSQKFHKSEIKGNMWTQDDFQQYLIEEFGWDVFGEKIQPKFKEIVINSLRCCSDQLKNRKRSFEVYGYDFMIDDQFNSWLIEVNMSPSSDTTTPVTAQIIPKMLEDIVKVVVDNQNKTKKKIGGFQLIYNSDTKLL
ncbi:unnamed protein product (macronuclear) [Paramecium tetraurelia]|uniref:Tubulin-tyrosine ligase family protein n=1 Tax=Paramecium tetraurelia TaxID=5888 RepID=A0BKH0_PARTE|nr:uncharacterized protein GSPATT00029668001 [Paramecium tetraurelia]CAK59037.1 unnamed protein product [Paramecium tetraurelia]|eukprot:XP_001426435.1 hypothetical protein (macronuclear) [Paramecium tetraurelia strain d4-2]